MPKRWHFSREVMPISGGDESFEMQILGTLGDPEARTALLVRLGRVIGRNRRALGISQEEFAARAGLHRTYISDVERGARNPSVDTLLRIAEALNTSAWQLLRLADHIGES